LRDAIDVIIGKLDEKISDASRQNSINSKKSPVPILDFGKHKTKERAVSNDFTLKL